MNKALLSLVLVVSLGLSACSTKPSHIGTVVVTNSGDEYSLSEKTTESVHVVGAYYEYQFVRNSESGFKGCTKLMNNAAKAYAKGLAKSFTPITWQTMQADGYIDHGRDLITAIMYVNCQYTFTIISTDYKY